MVFLASLAAWAFFFLGCAPDKFALVNGTWSGSVTTNDNKPDSFAASYDTVLKAEFGDGEPGTFTFKLGDLFPESASIVGGPGGSDSTGSPGQVADEISWHGHLDDGTDVVQPTEFNGSLQVTKDSGAGTMSIRVSNPASDLVFTYDGAVTRDH